MLWSCLAVFSRSQWGVGEGGRSEKSLAHPGSFLTSSTQCNIHWNLWKFHPSSPISSILFFPCPCRIPNRNLSIPLLALLGCLHLWTYEITSVWFVVFGITLIGLVCPVTLSKVTVPQHSYCSRLLNPRSFLVQRSLGFKAGCLSTLQRLLLLGGMKGTQRACSVRERSALIYSDLLCFTFSGMQTLS